MSFFGAVRLLVMARRQPPGPWADDDATPEIQSGAWATWAGVAADNRPRRAGLGDACRTGDGRAGRVVEIIERGRSVLLCQES